MPLVLESNGLLCYMVRLSSIRLGFRGLLMFANNEWERPISVRRIQLDFLSLTGWCLFLALPSASLYSKKI